MKLANALSLRSELQTRIRQLESRLDNNALVQEGESPAEDPMELLRELEEDYAQLEELIARINAVLRRTEIPDDTKKRLVFDKLIINLDSYELIVDGKKVDTPPKELELLYFLASSPNQVFTREQLLDHIWGYEYIGDTRTVDVHIKRLREKIKDNEYWSLSTVWGIGYKFEVKR